MRWLRHVRPGVSCRRMDAGDRSPADLLVAFRVWARARARESKASQAAKTLFYILQPKTEANATTRGRSDPIRSDPIRGRLSLRQQQHSTKGSTCAAAVGHWMHACTTIVHDGEGPNRASASTPHHLKRRRRVHRPLCVRGPRMPEGTEGLGTIGLEQATGRKGGGGFVRKRNHTRVRAHACALRCFVSSFRSGRALRGEDQAPCSSVRATQMRAECTRRTRAWTQNP